MHYSRLSHFSWSHFLWERPPSYSWIKLVCYYDTSFFNYINARTNRYAATAKHREDYAVARDISTSANRQTTKWFPRTGHVFAIYPRPDTKREKKEKEGIEVSFCDSGSAKSVSGDAFLTRWLITAACKPEECFYTRRQPHCLRFRCCLSFCRELGLCFRSPRRTTTDIFEYRVRKLEGRPRFLLFGFFFLFCSLSTLSRCPLCRLYD